MWVWKGNSPVSVENGQKGEAGYREAICRDNSSTKEITICKSPLSSEQFPSLNILFTWETVHFSSTGRDGGLFLDSSLCLARVPWSGHQRAMWVCGHVAVEEGHVLPATHSVCAQKALHEAVGLPRKHAKMFSQHSATWPSLQAVPSLIFIGSTFRLPSRACTLFSAYAADGGTQRQEGSQRREEMSKKPWEESRQGDEARLDNKHRCHCAEQNFHCSPCQPINCGRLSCWRFYLKDWSSLSGGRVLCRDIQGGPWGGE